MRNILRSVCVAVVFATGALPLTATEAWAQDSTTFDLSTPEGISAFLARYFSAERRGDAKDGQEQITGTETVRTARAEPDPEDMMDMARRLRDAASLSSTIADTKDSHAERMMKSADRAQKRTDRSQAWADLLAAASADAWEDADDSGLASDRREARRIERLARNAQEAADTNKDSSDRLTTGAAELASAALQQRQRSVRMSLTSRAIAKEARTALRD